MSLAGKHGIAFLAEKHAIAYSVRDHVRKDTKTLQMLQCSVLSVLRTTFSASSAKDLWDMLKKGDEPARLVNMESRRRRGNQCFQRGHYVRDYQTKIQVPKYRMLALNVADLAFDENMWMIYTPTTNHMTPHESFSPL